ncbi:MFS transporter [Paenibacillus sp. FSL W7-1332]|uniref:MFS transporter n=1 Tax=Paenibacillus sp. FSL W7-1332 TaxID=2921702 RepID=UPI0030CB2F4E
MTQPSQKLRITNVKGAFAWLGFLVFFSVLNETVFNVALPDIARQFHVEPSTANWVNTGFMLTFAIGSFVYGKMSDLYGIKKMLMIGIVTYGSGSMLGLAGHAYLPAVIAARFIQGAGASAIPALVMVMIVRYFDANQRGRAFGLIGSLVATGEGIGPVIGGVVAHYVHWSMLFVFPLMTLATIPFFLKVLPDETEQKGTIDVTGAVLLSVGVVLFTLFTTNEHWMYLAGCLAALVLFALRIKRASNPFIEPYLFVRKKFIAGTIAGCVILGMVAGFLSMVPYMMRSVHHLSTGMIGAGVMFPGAMSVMLFGILGGTLVDKKGHHLVFYIGTLMIIGGFLTMAMLKDQSPWIVTAMLIFVFGGLSFVKTVISTVVSDSLEEKEAGAGMGMLNFTCFLSEGIGVAIVGGLLSRGLPEFPLLPMLRNAGTDLYSNLLLLFSLVIVAGSMIYTLTYVGKRSRRI